MMSRGRLAFVILSLVVVFTLTAGTMVAASNQGDDAKDSPYKSLAVFMEVFGLVHKAYVDEPDPETLLAGAFEGTLDALDPFSQSVPASAGDAWKSARSIDTSRSGLLVLKERGVAYVVAVEEGSPADDAGLIQGDILSEIDGVATRATPLFVIHQRLAGEPGTVVRLERLRQGEKESVEVTLAEYARPAVQLAAQRGVGVLRVPGFFDGTYESVAASLDTLDQGAEALPGLEHAAKLVVDLRGVAGGDEAVAYRIAGLFASGELGVLDRRGEAIEVFRSAADASIWDGRLAILVDRGTQGAAEILAAVLAQSADAVLLGEPSFGHSGRQDFVELSDGSRLRITDAFFTGPDRAPITESLAPDVRVRRAFGEPEEGEELKDPVMERSLTFLIDDETLDEEELEQAA
ncbi:MAG: S41 family peptidase [Acidobacteriota bacterium]